MFCLDLDRGGKSFRPGSGMNKWRLVPIPAKQVQKNGKGTSQTAHKTIETIALWLLTFVKQCGGGDATNEERMGLGKERAQLPVTDLKSANKYRRTVVGSFNKSLLFGGTAAQELAFLCRTFLRFLIPMARRFHVLRRPMGLSYTGVLGVSLYLLILQRVDSLPEVPSSTSDLQKHFVACEVCL